MIGTKQVSKIRTRKSPTGTVTVLSLGLMLVITGCANSGNQSNTEPPSVPVEVATLRLEAGIVYNFGGTQAVAREDFLLVDTDFRELLWRQGTKLGFGELCALYLYPELDQEDIRNMTTVLKAHTKGTATTDFQGRASFPGIAPDKSWVVGFTHTRGGGAIWNLPILLKPGENSVILDQKNAVEAS
jgi:hypothetical protein